MSNHNHYALIMAGGEGTRFAPLSTPERPKQFLNLIDPKKSLLQQTYARLNKIFDKDRLMVGTNRRHLSLVQEQLPEIPRENIFDEPQKKNTAPCLAWVTRHVWRQNKKALIAAIPADHFVAKASPFLKCLETALLKAQESQKIVLIGMQPTRPSPEYGYIHLPTATFVEKPDRQTAERYFREGNYLWNGGIFVYPAVKMLELFERHQPEMFALLQSAASMDAFFEKAPSISIDYAIMEKTKELMVLPSSFVWSDVGTWDNLAHLAKHHSLNLSPEITKHFPQRARP